MPQTVDNLSPEHNQKLSAEAALDIILKKATLNIYTQGKILESQIPQAQKAANSLILVAIRYALQEQGDNFMTVSDIKDSIYDEFEELLIGIPAAIEAINMLPNLQTKMGDESTNKTPVGSEQMKEQMRYFLETFAAA